MMRLPGILGTVFAAAPPDGGTLVLRPSDPPGVVGARPAARLSPADEDLIRQTVGRDLERRLLPLQVLHLRRQEHRRLLDEALRQQGPLSWAAAFQSAVLQHLDLLIEQAASPLGGAVERLMKLLKDNAEGQTVSDAEFQQAVQSLLGAERQRQLLGGDDDPSEAMALVAQVLDVGAQRRNDELERLLDRAEQPGTPLPDKQLQDAIAGALGVERQKQLLGMSDDNAQSERVNPLVARALALGRKRKSETLKSLIEQVRQPGSRVDEPQLQQAVTELLGMERQCQLLGADSGSDAMALVVDAGQAILEKRGRALKQAYDRGAPAEIAKAEADYQAAKASLRRVGGTVPDGQVDGGEPQLNGGRPAASGR